MCLSPLGMSQRKRGDSQNIAQQRLGVLCVTGSLFLLLALRSKSTAHRLKHAPECVRFHLTVDHRRL